MYVILTPAQKKKAEDGIFTPMHIKITQQMFLQL